MGMSSSTAKNMKTPLEQPLTTRRPLIILNRHQEVKSLLRKTTPVAWRVLGESHDLTLKMRWNYAKALYKEGDAILGELREAVSMLEEAFRTARRVFGGAHPFPTWIEGDWRKARAKLAAHEGGDVSSVCDGVAAMTPGDA